MLVIIVHNLCPANIEEGFIAVKLTISKNKERIKKEKNEITFTIIRTFVILNLGLKNLGLRLKSFLTTI